MTRPVFTPSNNLYNSMPKHDYDRLMACIKEIGSILHPNQPGTHCYMGDDMAAWFRTLGFLDDPEFISATEPYKASLVVRAKLWRIYTYCWAVRTANKNTSSWLAVDLGTYDGKTVQIADRYTNYEMTWYLFDAFDHHPNADNKENHGADLVDVVKSRVSKAHVFKGILPDTLNEVGSLGIAFLHLDLNDADAELACLERLYDNVVEGGIILLDDYGWSVYRASQEAHKAFFKSKGHDVLEMSSGQGLVIKR